MNNNSSISLSCHIKLTAELIFAWKSHIINHIFQLLTDDFILWLTPFLQTWLHYSDKLSFSPPITSTDFLLCMRCAPFFFAFLAVSSRLEKLLIDSWHCLPDSFNHRRLSLILSLTISFRFGTGILSRVNSASSYPLLYVRADKVNYR